MLRVWLTVAGCIERLESLVVGIMFMFSWSVFFCIFFKNLLKLYPFYFNYVQMFCINVTHTCVKEDIHFFVTGKFINDSIKIPAINIWAATCESSSGTYILWVYIFTILLLSAMCRNKALNIILVKILLILFAPCPRLISMIHKTLSKWTVFDTGYVLLIIIKQILSNGKPSRKGSEQTCWPSGN